VRGQALAAALFPALVLGGAGARAGTAADRPTSINYSPLGVPTIDPDPLAVTHGSISGNVERMLSGRHAVVVELGRAMHRATGLGFLAAAVGYRLHLEARQASPFVGAMIGAAIADGDYSTGELGATVYDVRVRSLSASVHIGDRIAFDRVSFTGRVGIGWIAFHATADSADPGAPRATQQLEDELATPIAIDAELSIGYAF
jgi:hypothetical protein